VLNAYWGPLQGELADFQLLLVDPDSDEVLAEVHTGPLAWDGDDARLPAGIDAAVTAVVEGHRRGAAVDTLCALAVEVAPAARGRGLAGTALAQMSALARRHGLPRLIAPVRPSWKERYPLAAIGDT